MNKAFTIVILFLLVVSVPAQETQGPPKPEPSPQKIKKPARSKAAVAKRSARTPVAGPTPVSVDTDADRKRYDTALAAPTTAEKAGLLSAFLRDFPESPLREEAFSYLITARAVVGKELVQAGDLAGGMASYKLAVEEAPVPIPDRMFGDVILKIPSTLFYGDHRPEAMELAALIEKKVAADPKRLLGMAAFYLGIEDGADAKRVAEAVLAADPNSVAAYQALGLAHRLNFDLDEAAKAYSKALELAPDSASAKRSLAEMNRALGKADAAAAMYRELLAANEKDPVARQGLILSLFDAGQQKEAEAEFAAAIQNDTRNFSLLASVAYWYAAHDLGEKAVEYAQKAIDIEPRYIWGHIVLARGLMKQNRPLEAERVLLKARQYGNFPTMDYEIASARYQAGFYREAAEELRKSFSLKDGLVSTRLGGRIFKEEKGLLDLIGYERKASLLQPSAAESADNAEKLKLLLELERKAVQPGDETELSGLADAFVAGSDKMKLHRQLYVASLFLKNNIALAKVASLLKASLGNAESGLDVAAPGAAVMASELYESRTAAQARNEVIVIPEVPRQTLSAILRGRIEDLAGWTAFQQSDYPEAVVRLKRAISVLPDKSAWWRSSMWRLGAALAADGKEKEALESYIKSYITDRPSAARYTVIEAVYQRVNGTTEGLEEKIGPNPGLLVAATTPVAAAPALSEPASNSVSTPGSKPTPQATEPPPQVPARDAAVLPEVKVAADPKVSAVEALPNTDKPVSETGVSSKEPESKPAESNVEIQPAEKALPEAKPVVTNKPPTDPEPVKQQPQEQKTQLTDPAPPTVSENRELVTEKVPTTPIEPPAEAGADKIKTSRVPKENDVGKIENEKTQAAAETSGKDKPLTETPPQDPASQPKPVAKPEIDAIKEGPVKTVEKQDAPAVVMTPAKDSVAADETLPKKETSTPELAASDKPKAPADSGSQPVTGDTTTPPPIAVVKNDTDPKSTEPVNLLRDPFANTSPTPAGPPEKQPAKPLIIVNDPYKTEGGTSKAEDTGAKPKQLFEPIIIKVPENSQKPKGTKDPSVVEKTTDAETTAQPGTTRERVVAGKDVVSDQRCSLELSQQSIMLLSGGGSLGLLVKVVGEGDINGVAAASGSPGDIEVRPEPILDGVTGRRFFVIRSVSERIGVFQVSFESPCGKREVTVHVR